ncbi:hypothetical protein PENTCL1PPCAC_21572, partial [Pristionchus entomophagus]
KQPPIDVITRNSTEWIVHEDGIFYRPKLNVVFSWLGYAFLAIIVDSSCRKSVFRKHLHNVYLILFFALIFDFLEMGMHLFFIFNRSDEEQREIWYLPTTTWKCTLGLWLYSSHFFLTYVEAMISIHRFFLKTVHVRFMYIGIGIVFALQASLLVASISFGSTEALDHHWSSVSCTSAYLLTGPTIVDILVTSLTTAITPVLSILMIINGIARNQEYSGVTAFLLISSLSMFDFLISLTSWFLSLGFVEMPEFLLDFIPSFVVVAWNMEDFRFPLLCLRATLTVSDIRRAVFSTITESITMLCSTKDNKKEEVLLKSVETDGRLDKTRLDNEIQEFDHLLSSVFAESNERNSKDHLLIREH